MPHLHSSLIEATEFGYGQEHDEVREGKLYLHEGKLLTSEEIHNAGASVESSNEIGFYRVNLTLLEKWREARRNA